MSALKTWTEVGDRDEAASGTYRTWTLAAVAALLGVGLGVALTVTTVLIPRRAQLTRDVEPDAFLAEVSLQVEAHGVIPREKWSRVFDSPLVESSDGPGSRRAGSKIGETFFGTATLPEGEHRDAINRLADRIGRRAVIHRREWLTTPTGEGTSGYDLVLQYSRPGSTGLIRVVGVGRGDELTVSAMVLER